MELKWNGLYLYPDEDTTGETIVIIPSTDNSYQWPNSPNLLTQLIIVEIIYNSVNSTEICLQIVCN